MKKRLISMALAVSMAVSIMPAPALATVGGGEQTMEKMEKRSETQQADHRRVKEQR